MNHGTPFSIGVGVIIRRNGKVLVGLRTGKHGAGTYCFAGGHPEEGESIFACARRETKEETGLAIKNLRFGPYTEDVFAYKRYLTHFVIADAAKGEPVLHEPDKFALWRWCKWNHLPKPLFLPIINLRKTGFHPFHLP